jgi:hypothetical protein
MEIPIQTKLEERVYRAAEAALVKLHRRVEWDGTVGILCGRLLASGPHQDPFPGPKGARLQPGSWDQSAKTMPRSLAQFLHPLAKLLEPILVP